MINDSGVAYRLGTRTGDANLQSVATGVDLDELLKRGVGLKASDVHIHSGYPLLVRIAGNIIRLGEEPFHSTELHQALVAVLSERDRGVFEQKKDVDFTYEIPGLARFRGSLFMSHLGINASFRILPPAPSTLEALNLPAALHRFTEYHHGIVLITGPAGCGKSTTLAALINLVNEHHKGSHVLSLEEPIETLHPNKGCVVNQRQVFLHTSSYERAMRAALREDPDVIIIGEMRDAETISLALTAAETGHLVMASMHTTDAIKSISRIVDAFHPDKQSQIRTMLAESLQGVFSQVLLPTADGQSRVLAYELLFVTPAISSMIKEKKTFQIPSVMQTGKAQGMVTLSTSIGDLLRAGTITRDVAKKYVDESML